MEHPQTIESFVYQKLDKEFMDFSDGGDIEEDRIKAIIIELLKRVRNEGKTTHISMATGNCKVSVHYYAPEETASISVTKNYKEALIYFKEDGILDIGNVSLKVDPKSNKLVLKNYITWDN